MKLILTVLLALLISSAAMADYIEDRKLETAAAKVKILEIDAGAGSIEITGNDDSPYIRVKAEIIIEGTTRKRAVRFMEEFLKLNLENHGETARLESFFDFNNTFSLISTSLKTAEINLHIQMPSNIKLKIDDGSGWIVVNKMNNGIKLDDGSGDVSFENISGDLRIDDGSGEIELKNIKGNVSIDDGSGEITIKKIVGDIDIDDGSGEIFIKSVDGFVKIDDGSGDINIDQITQDVRIIDDSSGGQMISNVDGDVDIDD